MPEKMKRLDLLIMSKVGLSFVSISISIDDKLSEEVSEEVSEIVSEIELFSPFDSDFFFLYVYECITVFSIFLILLGVFYIKNINKDTKGSIIPCKTKNEVILELLQQ